MCMQRLHIAGSLVTCWPSLHTQMDYMHCILLHLSIGVLCVLIKSAAYARSTPQIRPIDFLLVQFSPGLAEF